MGKKLGRNGNKEGSIYNTIQKIDRKEKKLDFICDTCKKCSDRSLCNDRTGTNKCQKCIECTFCLKNGVCDRFYCYNRFPAQITLDDGSRTTVSNANTRTASVEKKKEVESQLQTKSYVKKNGITIIEVIKKIGDTKFDAGKIKDNTKDKDKYHYKHIENWEDFQKPVQKIHYQEIQDFLNSMRYLSQSELEKIFAKLKAGFMQCVMDKIIAYPDNPMLRVYLPVSKQMKEQVQVFEVEEQRKLMQYLRTQPLTKSSRCNYDERTLKNLFICCLLSAARIGELGALDINKQIDFTNKWLVINRTLTCENGKVVMGQTTKTGRYKIEQGLVDEHFVNMDIFDEKLMIDTLKDQIKNAKSNINNKENLLFFQKDGKYIDHRCINNIFKRICREAGVKLDLPKGCHTHMCRHAGVTRMIEAGMDLLVIASILGHSDDRQIKETYGHILNKYRNQQLKDSRLYYNQNNLSA